MAAGPKRKGKGIKRKQGKPRNAATPSAMASNKSNEPSPFELVTGQRKFPHVGQRKTAVQGSWTKAQKRGIKKREAVMKPELQRERSKNQFVDRRLGEGNAYLTDEDKAIQRLQHLRNRQLKGKRKEKFNLGDDDVDAGGEGEELTHLGQPLELADDFGEDEQEGEEGGLVRRERGRHEELLSGDKEVNSDATHAHDRPKTKRERLQEVIAKSKEEKNRRQQEKEEELKKVKELDETFKRLQEHGVGLPLRQKAPPLLRAREELREGASASADTQFDDYDALTKQIIQGSKGQPGERTLTEDEAAQLRAKEEAELERRKRKRAERKSIDEDEDEEEETEDRDAPRGGFALRRYKKRKKKGQQEDREGKAIYPNEEDGGYEDDEPEAEDEEEDDEESDGEEQARKENNVARELSKARPDLQQGIELLRQKGILQKFGVEQHFPAQMEVKGVAKEGRRSKDGTASGNDWDGDGGQDVSVAKDKPQGHESGGGNDDALASEREEVVESQEDEDAPMNEGDEGASEQELEEAAEKNKEHCPLTSEEWERRVRGRDAGGVAKLAFNIVSSNVPAKDKEQQKKLQSFLNILLNHFERLAGDSNATMASIDAVVPALIELSCRFPFFAVLACRKRLQRIQENLRKRLGEGEDEEEGEGADTSERQWPHPRSLLLFRLFQLVFPLSDFSHPVMTPTCLIIGEILALCSISTSREAALAVYLCDLALCVARAGSREFPEALTVLAAILHCAAHCEEEVPSHILHRLSVESVRLDDKALKEGGKDASEKLPLHDILHAGGIASGSGNAHLKCRVVASALRCARGFAEALEGHDAVPEAIEQCLSATRKLSQRTLPEALHEEARGALAAMERAAARRLRREPLRMGEAGTEAISEYNPKLATGDVDRARAERRNLLRQHSKEKRGAKKELRKDARYLAHAREEERARTEARRIAGEKSIYAALQAQEHDMRSGGQQGTWVGSYKEHPKKGSK